MLLLYLIGLLVIAIAMLILADRLLDAALGISSALNISQTSLAFMIVAIATSTPEFFVALIAATEQGAAQSLGLVIGSNILNMGLLLGLIAIWKPFPVHRKILRAQLPWLLLSLGFFGLLLFDLEISFFDGVLMFGGLGIIGYRTLQDEVGEIEPTSSSMPEITQRRYEATTTEGLVLIFGVILVSILILGEALVYLSVKLSAELGLTYYKTGALLLALGTCLPEATVCIRAVLRNHYDFAFLTILGSLIYNSMFTVGVTALLDPTTLDAHVLWIDYVLLIALVLFVALSAYGENSRQVISRFEGTVISLFALMYFVTLIT